MIVTVASFKGGVGKTTTAVHLAAYLQSSGGTMLVDGDPNRSATKWAKRGRFPFQVIDHRQGIRRAGDFVHSVIDTEAHPSRDDMEALAEGCDLLIIPSTPDRLSLDALVDTVTVLQSLGSKRYRILLTMVPPPPSRAWPPGTSTGGWSPSTRARLPFTARLPSCTSGFRCCPA